MQATTREGRGERRLRASQPHAPELKYRPDIDGLRAVAVLSVLASHLGLERAKGGFVGVDVFFVISGYLISSIILTDIAEGHFSIVAFYERRIRRIFPALFCVLFVSTIFALIYLLPIELVDYSNSMLAATFSCSNFYFWQHSDYFSSPTLNPLLHTWSLAVEEQFYILFPIFLLLVRGFFRRRFKTSISVLWTVSFLLSIVVVHYDRSTAFYMPYTRAWELLTGTLLSLKLFPRMNSAWVRNLATLAGGAMIIYPVLFYTPATPFPGLAALVPCLGSVLIIGPGESGSSLAGAALSWRPIVFVGLISYSLYLWHWPVIVLSWMGLLISPAHLMALGLPKVFTISRLYRMAVVGVSFVLAVLSYKFVEKPFRSGSLRLTGRPLFATAAGVMLLFAAFSLSTRLAGGYEARFSPQAVQLGSYLNRRREVGNPARHGICHILDSDRFENFNQDICLHQEPEKENYLLLGDSHAAYLWPGLSSDLAGANIMQATAMGCKPFIHPVGPGDCTKLMGFIYQSYLPAHPVQGLLLQVRWEQSDLKGLGETADWARERKIPIIIFGPVPEYDSPLPRIEAYAVNSNEPNLLSEHLVPSIAPFDKKLEDLARSTWHVPYVSLYRAICDEKGCIGFADAAHSVPLMFDTDHLSPEGSRMVVQRLIDRGELRLPAER